MYGKYRASTRVFNIVVKLVVAPLLFDIYQ